MALSKTQKVHAVIHSAAASAAGVGAGLAQLPMSDVVPLAAIQTAMISGIALIHGRKLTEGSATALLGTFGAAMFGRAISQALVGWIPGAGNAINASTAAAITEGIGWSAHKFFEKLGEEDLTEAEIIARARADLSMDEEGRKTQTEFLIKKSLMQTDERLLSFYNTALVSPIFDKDHTNSCIFITNRRVVLVKKSRIAVSVTLVDVRQVEVEHNTFSDDCVIVMDSQGLAHRFPVIRHEIAKGMKATILTLSGQPQP